MTKKTTETKPTRKKKAPGMTNVKESGVTTTQTSFLKDKGADAAKKAMTPVPIPASDHQAEIIPINAGGPALAAQATPAAVAITETTKRWADAKRMEAQGKREAEVQRKVIAEHFGNDPEKMIGYTDPNLEIKKSDDVAWDDPRLTTFLKEKGWFDALCKPPALDPDLVKSKALTEPELEAVIKTVTDKKPKFYQTKDVKPEKG